MSFYHILPSNTSPDTFPENHASSYSTPIVNPDMLDGEWEVALLSVSHSNCINTFNHDTLTLTDTSGDLLRISKPTKLMVPIPKTTFSNDEAYIKDVIRLLNTTLSGIVKFKVDPKDHNKFTYTFQTTKYHVYLNYRVAYELYVANVLTAYDHYKGNWSDVRITKNGLQEDDWYVILVPTDAPQILCDSRIRMKR